MVTVCDSVSYLSRTTTTDLLQTGDILAST